VSIDYSKHHLIDILKSTPEQLLKDALALSPKAIAGDGFVFVPGDKRMPLLVAHVDIIHPTIPALVMWDEKSASLVSPTGLGADDRAGVFAIRTLRDNITPKPALLFCDEEEIGGAGAFSAAFGVYDELCEFPYFLEIDRRGHGECVFYNNEGPAFTKYVEKFGFKEEWGSFSDISILGEECKKCSVNVSAGYHGEHTKEERLFLGSLENTIKKVKRMLLGALHTKGGLTFKLPKPKYKFSRSSYRYGFGNTTSVHGGLEWYDRTGWRDPDEDEFNARYQLGVDGAYAYSAPNSITKFSDFENTEKEYSRRSEKRQLDYCEWCGATAMLRYTDLYYGYCCPACIKDLEEIGHGDYSSEKYAG
jgi:hypothetical protein